MGRYTTHVLVFLLWVSPVLSQDILPSAVCEDQSIQSPAVEWAADERTNTLGTMFGNQITETPSAWVLTSSSNVTPTEKEAHSNYDKGDLPIIYLSGYDDEIFDLIKKMEDAGPGDEVKVAFYMFYKCKYYYLGYLTTTLKILKKVIKNTDHYYAFDKLHLNDYNADIHCNFIEENIIRSGFKKDLKEVLKSNEARKDTEIDDYLQSLAESDETLHKLIDDVKEEKDTEDLRAVNDLKRSDNFCERQLDLIPICGNEEILEPRNIICPNTANKSKAFVNYDDWFPIDNRNVTNVDQVTSYTNSLEENFKKEGYTQSEDKFCSLNTEVPNYSMEKTTRKNIIEPYQDQKTNNEKYVEDDVNYKTVNDIEKQNFWENDLRTSVLPPTKIIKGNNNGDSQRHRFGIYPCYSANVHHSHPELLTRESSRKYSENNAVNNRQKNIYQPRFKNPSPFSTSDIKYGVTGGKMFNYPYKFCLKPKPGLNTQEIEKLEARTKIKIPILNEALKGSSNVQNSCTKICPGTVPCISSSTDGLNKQTFSPTLRPLNSNWSYKYMPYADQKMGLGRNIAKIFRPNYLNCDINPYRTSLGPVRVTDGCYRPCAKENKKIAIQNIPCSSALGNSNWLKKYIPRTCSSENNFGPRISTDEETICSSNYATCNEQSHLDKFRMISNPNCSKKYIPFATTTENNNYQNIQCNPMVIPVYDPDSFKNCVPCTNKNNFNTGFRLNLNPCMKDIRFYGNNEPEQLYDLSKKLDRNIFTGLQAQNIKNKNVNPPHPIYGSYVNIQPAYTSNVIKPQDIEYIETKAKNIASNNYEKGFHESIATICTTEKPIFGIPITNTPYDHTSSTICDGNAPIFQPVTKHKSSVVTMDILPSTKSQSAPTICQGTVPVVKSTSSSQKMPQQSVLPCAPFSHVIPENSVPSPISLQYSAAINSISSQINIPRNNLLHSNSPRQYAVPKNVVSTQVKSQYITPLKTPSQQGKQRQSVSLSRITPVMPQYAASLKSISSQQCAPKTNDNTQIMPQYSIPFSPTSTPQVLKQHSVPLSPISPLIMPYDPVIFTSPEKIPPQSVAGCALFSQVVQPNTVSLNLISPKVVLQYPIPTNLASVQERSHVTPLNSFTQQRTPKQPVPLNPISLPVIPPQCTASINLVSPEQSVQNISPCATFPQVMLKNSAPSSVSPQYVGVVNSISSQGSIPKFKSFHPNRDSLLKDLSNDHTTIHHPSVADFNTYEEMQSAIPINNINTHSGGTKEPIQSLSKPLEISEMIPFSYGSLSPKSTDYFTPRCKAHIFYSPTKYSNPVKSCPLTSSHDSKYIPITTHNTNYSPRTTIDLVPFTKESAKSERYVDPETLSTNKRTLSYESTPCYSTTPPNVNDLSYGQYTSSPNIQCIDSLDKSLATSSSLPDVNLILGPLKPVKYNYFSKNVIPARGHSGIPETVLDAKQKLTFEHRPIYLNEHSPLVVPASEHTIAISDSKPQVYSPAYGPQNYKIALLKPKIYSPFLKSTSVSLPTEEIFQVRGTQKSVSMPNLPYDTLKPMNSLVTGDKISKVFPPFLSIDDSKVPLMELSSLSPVPLNPVIISNDTRSNLRKEDFLPAINSYCSSVRPTDVLKYGSIPKTVSYYNPVEETFQPLDPLITDAEKITPLYSVKANEKPICILHNQKNIIDKSDKTPRNMNAVKEIVPKLYDAVPFDLKEYSVEPHRKYPISYIPNKSPEETVIKKSSEFNLLSKFNPIFGRLGPCYKNLVINHKAIPYKLFTNKPEYSLFKNEIKSMDNPFCPQLKTLKPKYPNPSILTLPFRSMTELPTQIKSIPIYNHKLSPAVKFSPHHQGPSLKLPLVFHSSFTPDPSMFFKRKELERTSSRFFPFFKIQVPYSYSKWPSPRLQKVLPKTFWIEPTEHTPTTYVNPGSVNSPIIPYIPNFKDLYPQNSLMKTFLTKENSSYNGDKIDEVPHLQIPTSYGKRPQAESTNDPDSQYIITSIPKVLSKPCVIESIPISESTPSVIKDYASHIFPYSHVLKSPFSNFFETKGVPYSLFTPVPKTRLKNAISQSHVKLSEIPKSYYNNIQPPTISVPFETTEPEQFLSPCDKSITFPSPSRSPIVSSPCFQSMVSPTFSFMKKSTKPLHKFPSSPLVKYSEIPPNIRTSKLFLYSPCPLTEKTPFTSNAMPFKAPVPDCFIQSKYSPYSSNNFNPKTISSSPYVESTTIPCDPTTVTSLKVKNTGIPLSSYTLLSNILPPSPLVSPPTIIPFIKIELLPKAIPYQSCAETKNIPYPAFVSKLVSATPYIDTIDTPVTSYESITKAVSSTPYHKSASTPCIPYPPISKVPTWACYPKTTDVPSPKYISDYKAPLISHCIQPTTIPDLQDIQDSTPPSVNSIITPCDPNASSAKVHLLSPCIQSISFPYASNPVKLQSRLCKEIKEIPNILPIKVVKPLLQAPGVQSHVSSRRYTSVPQSSSSIPQLPYVLAANTLSFIPHFKYALVDQPQPVSEHNNQPAYKSDFDKNTAPHTKLLESNSPNAYTYNPNLNTGIIFTNIYPVNSVIFGDQVCNKGHCNIPVMPKPEKFLSTYVGSPPKVFNLQNIKEQPGLTVIRPNRFHPITAYSPIFSVSKTNPCQSINYLDEPILSTLNTISSINKKNDPYAGTNFKPSSQRVFNIQMQHDIKEPISTKKSKLSMGSMPVLNYPIFIAYQNTNNLVNKLKDCTSQKPYTTPYKWDRYPSITNKPFAQKMKSNVEKFINSNCATKDCIFNGPKQFEIPLGKIGIAKYSKNLHGSVIETENPCIDLKIWTDKVKIVKAKICFETEEKSVVNFMPVVNKNCKLNPDVVQNLAKNLIYKYYGCNPIVLKGWYTIYRPYAVIYNPELLCINSRRYYILWPTYCNCGCGSCGCKCCWQPGYQYCN